MRAHLQRAIGAAAALFIAVASSAQAQGKEKAKDHDKRKEKHQVVTRDVRREVRGRDGLVYAGPEDPRVNDPRYPDANRRVPPGLAKKPGGMPPGQYKKLYPSQGAGALREVLGRRGYTVVRSEGAGNNEYVYYRLRDGATQRAVVSPGRDRLQFGNVPSSLLSEVLPRLY